MAEREACGELVASVKAELNNDKKVDDKKVVDDESSCSEYEEIIEEYTATESEDDEQTTTTTTTKTIVNADKKQQPEVKKTIEEVKKTTITKKEEPKQTATKTVVVEKTTVVKKDTSAPSGVEEKKSDKKIEHNVDNDDETNASTDSNKGESLLIPLLQGLLHKNMPQARSSSGTSKTTASTTTRIANQNSNNLKSSLKSNQSQLSSTSSNNNNSLGDSELSSEVSKSSTLGQGGSNLRVTAQHIEDSGTESGEDLRLIAAGIRDSMQIEGIEDQSDMSLINEVTNALNRLESSLKEGKDLALDNGKRNTLLALVERLQTGLTAPDKLSKADGEQDFPDETSSPEADNHRSNRQRFAKRRNRNNRHTVGVSKEELADARRYIEEMVMIENMSNCTTPESNVATTPPQFFEIQKQNSSGAILTNKSTQNPSSNLFRPNQFVPSTLKHSTEAGAAHPDVQLRQKKGNPGNPSQRQSAGNMDNLNKPETSTNKRPLSDSYDSYSTQNNRVKFSDTTEQSESLVQEKNQYNRSHHSDNQPDVTNRVSPDITHFSFNRFNNKKQMMKRANTIDIPKTHSYNPEFDTDSEFEEKSSFKVKGLRGTVQVSVKRKPRQVVPNFEPKTENDHKFLAFIQKQNTAPGLAWKNSKSVSNWTNKFGNIKNVFESGAPAPHSSGPKVPAQSESSAKSFWKKTEENNPQKVSSNVLTSALKAKERSQQVVPEVIVPQPIHLNNFIHNPQSAFRPIENPPEPVHQQFKPIPMERPTYTVSSYSPTKPYNPAPPRRQVIESPHYSQPSPTKTWVKQNTATNSPVTLPWTVKPPENSVLKLAATKFEERPPLNAVRRHQSFKQQEAQKRPSLPNTMQPCQYPYDGYSQPNYMSNSHPTSYSEYSIPRAVREDSLTNPQAEPLVLTPNKPAYSPHSLQPYEYYSQDLNANIQQSDMTDDDIDDLESMTEYRVEAKVMGKPVSQQAVTIGNRTAHMSDDEVFGKNSRAAKSLLSVMKTIGNGNGDAAPKKKVDRKPVQANNCISPNGRDYQAPIVEPLFPEVTKFEVDRTPKYVGEKPYQPQPIVEYQSNPAYVPLTEYQPPQPPRRNHVPQDTRNASNYYPQERPNVNPLPLREVPHHLPIQSEPISPASYTYSSPTKTPESAPYIPQIIPDPSYIQNLPSTDQSYSESTISDDYTLSRDTYQPSYVQETHNQYNSTPKGYPGPQPRPVVNLPQIPLETSYTKVYDKPLDMSAYQQPPVAYQTSPNYQSTPYQQMYPPADGPRSHVQQSSISQQSSQHQPSPYSHQEQHYQSPQIKQNVESPGGYPPQGTYQSPNVQQSPQSPGYPPQGTYQSPKIQQSPQTPGYPPQGAYQSPKIQQNPQSPGYPPQGAYQSPKIQQNPQSPGYPPQGAYQSPKIQQNPQSPGYPPQGAYQSPKAQQSPQSPGYPPQGAYQPQKTQQSPQSPGYPPQLSYQSPKIQSTPQSPGYPSQVSYQSPKIQQNTQSPAYPPQGVQQPSAQMQQSYQPPMIQQPQIETPPQNRTQQSSKSAAPLQQTYQPRPEIPAQQYQSPKAQAPSKPQRSVRKTEPSNQGYQPPKSQASLQQKPQIPRKSETVVQSSKTQHITASYQQQHSQNVVSSASPIKQPLTNKSTALSRQTSLDGQKRVQAQSKVYEQVDQIRRKSLGNILEITRIEREAQEQKAAAIKQDMYSVQQDVYSQQMKTERKTEIHHQQEKKVYKSSAPDDTPDIVKSSLKQDDIPILKKFGPPQRHCYIPNAYQNPLTKSETVVMPKNPQPTPRKLSEPSAGRGPVIVETPSTPQPDSQDEIPRNIVFNNVNAFTSMTRRQGESSIEYSSQQNRPNKLSKCDSWHQICQIQNAGKPPSPKFNTGSSGLRRSKSGHTLALPKLYEAGYDKTEISEKQKTVAAYFSGQKSPNSLSRNSSQSNLAEESTTVSVKKSSINRIRTSEKASISKQSPSSGLCRSHTMPQIANINLLDESNVEDAFEQLMNGS